MADVAFQPGWLRKQTLGAAVTVAWERLRVAKVRMDEAQAAFDAAEERWREASAELDRLEAEQSKEPFKCNDQA